MQPRVRQTPVPPWLTSTFIAAATVWMTFFVLLLGARVAEAEPPTPTEEVGPAEVAANTQSARPAEESTPATARQPARTPARQLILAPRPALSTELMRPTTMAPRNRAPEPCALREPNRRWIR